MKVVTDTLKKIHKSKLSIYTLRNYEKRKLNKPGFLSLTFYLVTVLSFQLHSSLFASALLSYSVISSLYCLAYVCSYTHRYKHTHMNAAFHMNCISYCISAWFEHVKSNNHIFSSFYDW